MPVSAGLFHCAGDARKFNWVLVRHNPDAKRCVVFFPGDISDFASSSAPYCYSVEALLWVLCLKFPEDTVVLVRPRMLVEHFAVYVNFMLVDGTGNPRPLKELRADDGEGGEGGAVAFALQPPDAVQHLERLLSSLEGELHQALPERLVLAGFSKGAAVLAALLRSTAEHAPFWGRVESAHFVDAGLCAPGSFPVEEEDLRQLSQCARPGFTIWLHGTPRQMQDPGRPFVAEEAAAFLARCEAAGVRTEKRMYAEGQAPSLDMHFDSLRCFVTGDGDEDCGSRHCGFFRTWAEAALGGEP